MNDWERSLREQRYQFQHQHQQQHQTQPRSKTPSFSSSLLDAIYRSIDEPKYEDTQTTAVRTKKQRNSNLIGRKDDVGDEKSLRKAIMFEKWMENDEIRRRIARGSSRTYNSASSSSDSSCGGVFSSSETESVHRDGSKSISFTIQRPKEVRIDHYSVRSEFEDTPKREGRLLMRTKSKALKIYGDLKKVKQPISPGRRITSFLNSLFNSRNVKNPKPMEGLNSLRKSRSVKDHHQTTTCSLSSSFSRSSCLNKLPPPSSRGAKFTSGNNCSKRSVRFCLVDEDSRRRGQKGLYEEDPRLMPTPVVRKITEITVLNKEEVKNTNECRMRGFEDEDLDEDEDYDDGMSCASSDLFELENIGAIGGGTCREELPVYGTTSLKKNHAIVNGFSLVQ
ncbi:hypothetical protein Vadar_016847 [Vaccinium darrowii]|uniref:Uncharacterized protein n=1 Tax=Vaccinium darrowii TaxID=229202 RepID=A0ACB7YGA2_9ERIC|nr:hypothetical protein Vadar_016847 [Vaccinium darrowii]